MIRRPPRSTRTDHSFPTRRSSDLYDADFVTANAVGFDVLKRAVAGFTPDHVSRVVGVPKNQILLAARTFAAAKSGCVVRSEEHTSELQSLMRISYAVFCLKKKKTINI